MCHSACTQQWMPFAGASFEVPLASHGVHTSGAGEPDKPEQLQRGAAHLSHLGLPQHAWQPGGCRSQHAPSGRLESPCQGVLSQPQATLHSLDHRPTMHPESHANNLALDQMATRALELLKPCEESILT